MSDFRVEDPASIGGAIAGGTDTEILYVHPTGVIAQSPNLRFDSLNTVYTDAGSFIIEQRGGSFGTTRLSILNGSGTNGVRCAQAGSVNLVDFMFLGNAANQQNIRYEGRPAYIVDQDNYTGTNSGEFQFLNPGVVVPWIAWGEKANTLQNREPSNFTKTASDIPSFTSIQDLAADDRFLYITDSQGNFAISESVITSGLLTPLSSINLGAGNPLFSVAVASKNMCVTVDASNLYLINTKNKSSPSVITNVATAYANVKVIVKGQYALCVGTGGVDIIDLVTQLSVATYAMNFEGNVTDADLHNDILWFCGNSPGYIEGADLSIITAPIFYGAYNTGVALEKIRVEGNYAVVTDNGRIWSYSLAVPTPAPISNTGIQESATGLILRGRTAYIYYGHGLLDQFDVKDMANMFATGSSTFDTLFSVGGPIADLGQYLYIGGGTQICRVSLGGLYAQHVQIGSLSASVIDCSGNIVAFQGRFNGGLSVWSPTYLGGETYIGSTLTLEGAFKHTGSYFGAFGTTPIAQPSGDLATGINALGLMISATYGGASPTELSYVAGLTSTLQTQLDRRTRLRFSHYADSTVGGAEADIYSDTLSAGQLGHDGDVMHGMYGGNFVTIGTEVVQLKVKFAGTTIWDSTGIAVTTGTTSWRVFVDIIRKSSSSILYTVSMNTTGASGFVYCTSGELTGLTLSNTNILKITGTSSGVGSGSGDIVGKMSYVDFAQAP